LGIINQSRFRLMSRFVSARFRRAPLAADQQAVKSAKFVDPGTHLAIFKGRACALPHILFVLQRTWSAPRKSRLQSNFFPN
jgi:hypothetical protein